MHWARCALHLAAASAGSSIAARMAIMAITTSNSINVNAPPGPTLRCSFDFFTDIFFRVKLRYEKLRGLAIDFFRVVQRVWERKGLFPHFIHTLVTF